MRDKDSEGDEAKTNGGMQDLKNLFWSLFTGSFLEKEEQI